MLAAAYEFDALIVHHYLGSYRYTVVFLPDDIARDLPFDRHPRLRVSGEVGEVPFDGAWQPVSGRWYLMLSKRLLKDAGLAVGDRTEVRFRIDDQAAVEIPSELLRAIEADDAAAAAWTKLSPGKRRAWSHRVVSAKTGPTRSRRVVEVIDRLRAGTAGKLMLKTHR